MFVFLLILQIIGLAVVWANMAQVFFGRKSLMQELLYYIFMCMLFNQVAMFFNLQATTMDGALLTLKIAYLGRAFVITYLLSFTLRFCDVEINNKALGVSVLLQFALLITIWTAGSNNLFFKTIEFSENGAFPHLVTTPGITQIIYYILMFIHTISMIIVCVTKLRTIKIKAQRARIICTLFIPITLLVGFIIQCFSLTGEYDSTSMVYLVACVILSYAINKYELIDYVAAAKDIIVDEFADAVLVTDNDDKLVYFNKQAEKLFPNIVSGEERNAVMENLEDVYRSDKEMWIDTKLYVIRKKELTKKESSTSQIFTLTDNTSAYKLTYGDGLTNVGNRRALMRAMEAFEPDEDSYFVIMDIDNFKRINDTYGHQVGDECLVRFATVLSTYFGSDSVYRFGGDEFVLLVKMDSAEIENRLNSVNATLSDDNYEYPYHVSGGYVKLEKGAHLETLMKRADDALYEVKKSGKGRFAKA